MQTKYFIGALLLGTCFVLNNCGGLDNFLTNSDGVIKDTKSLKKIDENNYIVDGKKVSFGGAGLDVRIPSFSVAHLKEIQKKQGFSTKATNLQTYYIEIRLQYLEGAVVVDVGKPTVRTLYFGLIASNKTRGYFPWTGVTGAIGPSSINFERFIYTTPSDYKYDPVFNAPTDPTNPDTSPMLGRIIIREDVDSTVAYNSIISRAAPVGAGIMLFSYPLTGGNPPPVLWGFDNPLVLPDNDSLLFPMITERFAKLLPNANAAYDHPVGSNKRELPVPAIPYMYARTHVFNFTPKCNPPLPGSPCSIDTLDSAAVAPSVGTNEGLPIDWRDTAAGGLGLPFGRVALDVRIYDTSNTLLQYESQQVEINGPAVAVTFANLIDIGSPGAILTLTFPPML